MKVAKQRCCCCGHLFEPDPDAVCVVRGVRRVTQKVCGRAECRQAWARKKLRRWRKLHPESAGKYAPKVRAWAKAYPDYWQHYRASRPEYVRRDNARRCRAVRAARRSANETGLGRIAVDKLGIISALHEAGCSANEMGLSRRIGALEDYVLSTSRHLVPQTVTGVADAAGSVRQCRP